MEHAELLGLSPEEKKAGFKQATITHRLLEQADRLVMRAIREHGGFAYVFVYGPSGAGKTTMIHQVSQRLNGSIPPSRAWNAAPSSSASFTPVPVLVLETRPPDGAAFNRADYYRNALVKLGEPFYEHRRLVDIHTEYAGERRTQGRGKVAHFNESSELRNAMEEAMQRHGVRAVILDEAQHVMTIGNGASGSSLLDQLDWIKSMTNVTDIVHILVGTYDLLSFTRLNGQTSRRGLPIHFPRYQLQREEDCTEFQAALLALLKKVPLHTDAEALVVKHWLYFYERCIGCVGVLKDWLLRAVSAALDEGDDTLTLQRVQEHALSISQCEQMALDAVEGEQKLNYTEGRREHLWRLLQGEGILPPASLLPARDAGIPQPLSSPTEQPMKKAKTRPGQQAPRRTPVGGAIDEEPSTRCPFTQVAGLEPAQLNRVDVRVVECPECGSVRTIRTTAHGVVFPSHTPLVTRTTKDGSRWVKQGTTWALSEKKA
jgi:AAA domain